MDYSYFDFLERAKRGKAVSKTEWDYEHVMLAIRKLVDKYQVKWDKKTVIPMDFDLADRVFQAGYELAQITGVYYQPTGTIISFEKGELETAIKSMPTDLVMGEGEQKRTLVSRQICDPRPPIVWGGNPGAPTPIELFQPMVSSWIREPIVDLATCGSLTHFGEYEVRTGEPSEISATRLELRMLRQALDQAGRPGMGLLAAQSSVSELGDLAVAHPDYLRPCDAHLVVMLNELMFDQKNMARVANSLDYGMRNASLAAVMVGGLGGDAPGSAVLQVASLLSASLICRAHYHLLHPIHIRHTATSTRAVLWVQALVLQAFARNAPMIIVADIYPKSGAMTHEIFYETAANAIVATVCGGHLEGVGGADGALPNSTGLECRWMGEVGHAVAREQLSVEEANKIVSGLLEKYEWVFKNPGGNPGVRFDKAYNLEKIVPLPAYQRIYDQVRSFFSDNFFHLK